MQVGSLGDIVFEVNIPGAGRTFTPSALSMESAARFEEHQVLGAPPRLEFLAPELDVNPGNVLVSTRFVQVQRDFRGKDVTSIVAYDNRTPR